MGGSDGTSYGVEPAMGVGSEDSKNLAAAPQPASSSARKKNVVLITLDDVVHVLYAGAAPDVHLVDVAFAVLVLYGHVNKI